jgi:glycosyltransferase involved in cell wall biosynthesis
MKSLVVLLPTLNEADGLRWVHERLPLQELRHMGFETTCIVADGHSDDGSSELAEVLSFDVFEQVGKGKGLAIRQGFEKAMTYNPDIIVMLDADGTYDPKEMVEFVPHLSRHDVIIGNRLCGRLSPRAMTKLNLLGNHILTWFASILFNRRCEDLCSGYWMFSSKALEKMKLNSIEFELEAEMFATCVHLGLDVEYVPIQYLPRIGEAKLGSTSDGWHILKKLIIRRIFPLPYDAKQKNTV